jgi:hypothetical protein
MSEMVTELASIEISKDLLELIDIKGVLSDFKDNFKKLDDLKKFRTEYEKRNFLMRLWHRRDLKDAQLDATQVQADFSKSIGQLLMISIMQSKMLSNQQSVLNEQQIGLKIQAEGIQAHTIKIEEQHGILKEQSERLENLVKDYFELKGLTDKGAEKLIQIARETKATKQDMVAEFDSHVAELVEISNHLTQQVEEQLLAFGEQVTRNAEKVNGELQTIRNDANESRNQIELTIHAGAETVRVELDRIEKCQQEQFANLSLSVHVHEEQLLNQKSTIVELERQLSSQRTSIETAVTEGRELKGQTVKLESTLETCLTGLTILQEAFQSKIRRLTWATGLSMVASLSLIAWFLMVIRGQ